MTKYSNAISATLILSLFSSLVHGQDYNERTGKLLIASNGFQCFSDGFHVDPNDCAVFYRCTEWGESSENSIQSRFIPIKFRCTEGMVFDIERSNCVNVEETSRLECRLLADDEDLYSRISERQAGDADYGVVQPAPGYNNQYQQPSYNRPGPQEPNEQNPGDSGDGDGSGNEPMPPSKSPPCEADGFFPIPNDCTHFYRCVSNGNGFLKYDFSCGPGTVWDPDNNVCNHPWAVSRTDCKSGTDGGQGGSEYEISEPPESGAQVGESSSTTTAATTTNRPGYPSQSTTSASYNRPTTTKSTTTTTKRSTSNAPSTTTTTESSETSPAPEGPGGPEGSKDNSTSGGSGGNSCTSEGFFPDEKNCTKFYRCVNEGNNKFTKYEFECAEGTVWDVQETTCNYPYAVQNDRCNSNSSETQTAPESGQSPDSTPPNSQTSSRPTSPSTSSSNNRPSTSSPSSSNNKPTSQSSGSNNQQSSSSQTTSSSSQSSSTASQTTSSSSQSSSSSSQTTSSQQSSSSTSSTSSQSTSSNQQTSGSQQSSSSTSSASNQNNNNTETNAGSTTTSNNGSQTSKSDKCESEGFFPSSENCNKFYRCVSNEVGGFTKYNFNCGPGTVWDPDNNVCNHPWAVRDEKCRSGGGGGGAGSGGQGTTPMGESTTQSPTTSSSQNNTTPTASASTTESPDSPTGSSSSTTTSPVDSSSEPGTSVTTTTPETSSKPTETPEHSSSTTTTDPTDVSTTPASNSNTTTTEAGSKNSTKPNNGIKCEKAGYYPNPTNCKKFYRCVDWDGDKGERFSVYHFDCPAGTIFDPSLNVCNHEESVYPPRDCSGNGSQTTDSTPTSKPDNSTNTESPSTTENSNTTEATEAPTTEPTTLQTTTDASTITKEPTTTGTGETTPQITTQPESTTKKETETTTAVTSITTTQISTVQPTTQQPTTTESSTTPSSETCPELGPDQYALVCPTGFRRHPKFCNLFYQCTVSKTMETKIVTLSCVNGTLYDEKKIQCLPPDETKKCEGSIMTDSRNLKKSNDLVTPITVKSEKSICPNEGLFSYKDDCRLFYKCKKDEQGKMTGFLYQCPEGFAFWSVSKRCEKTEKVPCENTKTAPTSWKSTLAPVESKNIGF